MRRPDEPRSVVPLLLFHVHRKPGHPLLRTARRHGPAPQRLGGPTVTEQGWSRADFHCGRCGEHITTTTEAEYVSRVSAHQRAHQLVDQMTPEQRRHLVALLG